MEQQEEQCIAGRHGVFPKNYILALLASLGVNKSLPLGWLASLYDKPISTLNVHTIIPLLVDKVHEASSRDWRIESIQHHDHAAGDRVRAVSGSIDGVAHLKCGTPLQLWKVRILCRNLHRSHTIAMLDLSATRWLLQTVTMYWYCGWLALHPSTELQAWCSQLQKPDFARM
jgi:hypothetical protein